MTLDSQQLFASSRNLTDRLPQVIESYDVRRRGPLYSRRMPKPRRTGRATWDGERLKEIREDRRLSQNELSEKSGVSAAELSRHERNATESNPTIDVLARLAAALAVPLTAIVEPVGSYVPRPEEKTIRGDVPIERAALLDAWLKRVDQRYPAEDSARGDLAQAQSALAEAQAALARATRRAEVAAGPSTATEPARRRAAQDS